MKPYKLGYQCFHECRNAPLPFAKQIMNRVSAVPSASTGVGTRFYYSQNDLGTVQARFPVMNSRVQEPTRGKRRDNGVSRTSLHPRSSREGRRNTAGEGGFGRGDRAFF